MRDDPDATRRALTVPLLIVVVALVPTFVICPFLGDGRQCLLIRLLASLAQ